MKYFLTAFILLFTFTGCQDQDNDSKTQAEHDAKIRAEERAKVLAEFNAQKEKQAEESNGTLSKLGINIKEDSIVIDKKQTKQFFNELKDKMQTQMKEISDEVSTGIEDTKQASISLATQHIDMNKTKDLLKTWNKKIEDFVEEFDTPKDSNISKGK